MTQKSRRRAIAAGRNLDYFVGRSPSGVHRLGVWERDGRHLHPILSFIDRPPTYRERLKFYAIAQATYERVYQWLFNEAHGCNRDGEALGPYPNHIARSRVLPDGRAVTGDSIPENTPVKKIFLCVSLRFERRDAS